LTVRWGDYTVAEQKTRAPKQPNKGDGGQGPLLEARGITKAFGSLLANDHVDLKIYPGEIHALLGENGAGKSTLVKIMYGVLRQTSGDILWRGKPIEITGPAHARDLGIGMVFQHFSLFEALNVAENIALALSDDQSLDEIAAQVRDVSLAYGLPLEPYRAVHTLSVGERQRIEIVRCLLQNPKLLVMDEPTSVLTPQEAERLFETLERLSGEGCAILYISHRLEEVKRLCRAATILRHGKNVGECDPQKETASSMARMMVGEDVVDVKSGEHVPGEVRLLADDVSVESEEIFGVDLQNISFQLRAGEILGIAGIAGNGQDEFFSMLSGELPAPPGSVIEINGTTAAGLSINERRKLGAAFVPEERMGHGAVPHLVLSENSLLSIHAVGDAVRMGMVNQKETARYSGGVIKRFDVRVPRPDPYASNLSGGNLQKFMIGREIMLNPSVLVVNQPTWGVDAGAAATIRQALIDLATAGSAILVISQDLDEIYEICDRIAVISDGQLSDARPASELDIEEIGLLMGGIHGEDAPAEEEGTAHAS